MRSKGMPEVIREQKGSSRQKGTKEDSNPCDMIKWEREEVVICSLEWHIAIRAERTVIVVT